MGVIAIERMKFYAAYGHFDAESESWKRICS